MHNNYINELLGFKDVKVKKLNQMIYLLLFILKLLKKNKFVLAVIMLLLRFMITGFRPLKIVLFNLRILLLS